MLFKDPIIYLRKAFSNEAFIGRIVLFVKSTIDNN